MSKMEFGSFLFIICIINMCFQTCLCSYLGYPRIYFRGTFTADVNTANNVRCYYCNEIIDPERGITEGTNEFHFEDTTVTSVVNELGKNVPDSIVGQSIVLNDGLPLAKISDLDVECQFHSMLFGMVFGIIRDDGTTAFSGDWTPSIIVQYREGSNSQSMTTITGIDWSNIGDSEVLKELKNAVDGGDLVVKVSLRSYSSSGTVVGFLGVPSLSDTLNVPGAREMLVVNTDISDLDISYLNTAPFELDTELKELRVDLSNSLPRAARSQVPVDIGELHLGYVYEAGNCVQLLGDENGLEYTIEAEGGIHVISLESETLVNEVQTSQIVLAKIIDGDGGSTNICSETVFSSSTNGETHTAEFLLEELVIFVRPTGVYIDRLNEYSKSITTMKYYVTEYGLPLAGAIVQQGRVNQYDGITKGPPQPVLPADGVIPTVWSDNTNNDGYVSFDFKLNTLIPANRQYYAPDCRPTGCPDLTCPDLPCSLPIDGQVYYFSMCAMKQENDLCQNPKLTTVILAFSDYKIPTQATWVDDVGPILNIYDRVTPYMQNIMNMSDCNDVLSKADDIRKVFTVNFNSSALMPTTRDLSPAKVQMILNWLDGTNQCDVAI